MDPETLPDYVRNFDLTKNVRFSEKKTYIGEEEMWEDEATLGEGSYGKVVMSKCITGMFAGSRRAVKTIEIPEGGIKRDLKRELEAIFLLSDRKEDYSWLFVKAWNWYLNSTGSSLSISMQFLPWGDLKNRVKGAGKFNVQPARSILQQLVAGICWMHKKNFTHRDIKLKNILIADETEGYVTIKIADFGITKHLEEVDTNQVSDHSSQTADGTKARGTDQYMSPELWRWKYNEGSVLTKMPTLVYLRSDMWAIGVVAYELLTAESPFKVTQLGDKSQCEMVKSALFTTMIKKLNPLPQNENSIPNLKNFILGLLELDPKKRSIAKKAEKDPWLNFPLIIDKVTLTDVSLKQMVDRPYKI